MTMAQDTTGTAPEGSADGAPVPVAEVTAEKPSSDSPVTIPLPSPPPTGSGCELHVWPTENYLGFNSGLLSGFGLIGAVADQAAHQGRVKSVKELMADYLGPDIQIEELNKIGLNQTLGLTDYRILIEEPTPSHDDAKAHPEIKAKAKAMNAKIKAGQRLSDSTSACYAELFISYVMYHKAMMYGSNLFVGTMYRNFTTTDGKPIQSVGAVKNPLEHFPPKSPDVIATAQLELREAFAKDFTEWSQKKLKK
jgi:hypothetical protein